MQNRIRHLLKDWKPVELHQAPEKPVEADPGIPKLPRGINMLMPVELCINRDLLISLLSASIQEIYRHKRIPASPLSDSERDQMEASLQQQLAFRAWARDYPSGYISIAMYPVSEVDTVEDLEDLGEF
ncbi:MAG: hypothetical protein ABI587_03005 [Gemmatimonadales bacterium]